MIELMRIGIVMALVLSTSVVAPGWARADDDDDGKAPDYGLGGNARQLLLTRGVAEVFSDSAPPGTRTQGFSVEFAKRGERLEFVLGFGYDNLEATNGYYLESGGTAVTPGKVTYTDFRGFHIFSIDATIVGYLELHKILAIRYGAGLGVGLVRGQIRRTDALCTSEDIRHDCVPNPAGPRQQEPVDIPKAIPVLNGLIGLQFRPAKALAINLDLGLRNVPYVGASAMFYLW